MPVSKKSDSSATSTKFPMVYHVEYKENPRSKTHNIVDVDPTKFHAYVKRALKTTVSITTEGRRAQLQRYIYYGTDLAGLQASSRNLIIVDWSLDDVEPKKSDRVQPSLTEQLKLSLQTPTDMGKTIIASRSKKETATPRTALATNGLTSRRSNTPSHHHVPGVVSIMNNKQATAFDQRYADYDPMILVAGRRKDVIASLEKVTMFRVNGQLVSRTHSPGDAVCMDGNITVDDEVQIDVSHKDDYRVVFFKF